MKKAEKISAFSYFFFLGFLMAQPSSLKSGILPFSFIESGFRNCIHSSFLKVFLCSLGVLGSLEGLDCLDPLESLDVLDVL